MDDNGRVIIHEGVAPAAPGTCLICMTSGGGGIKFVDFKKNIRKYGRIYFCDRCFEEVNCALGWVSPANFDLAELELLKLKELNDKLKEENAKLSSAIGSGIPDLIANLSSLRTEPSTPKRGPGRPKKAESGTPE